MGITLQYFIFVSVAAAGAIQVAAVVAGLRGLFLLRGRWPSLVLGVVAVVLSFIWFFREAPWRTPAHVTGLEGAEQFSFYLLAIFVATVATLLLSSLVNAGLGKYADDEVEGLEGLKDRTYWEALGKTYRYWMRRWRERIPGSSSG